MKDSLVDYSNLDTKSIYLLNNNTHHEMFKTLKKHVPVIDFLIQTKTSLEAYELALNMARENTERNKILILAESANNIEKNKNLSRNYMFETILGGNSKELCNTIANSIHRIAAIVVQYKKATPHYYKKVRELTSAEGAFMIWDALDDEISQFEQNIKISKHSQPDIICFRYENSSISNWIGYRNRELS